MQAPWFQHRKTHGTHLNKAAICTKNPTKTVWTWTENLNTQLRCNIQWWQTMTNAKDWMCCQTKQRVHQLVTQFAAWFLFFNPAISKTVAFTNGQTGSRGAFLILNASSVVLKTNDYNVYNFTRDGWSRSCLRYRDCHNIDFQCKFKIVSMEFICHPVVYCCLDLVRVILCNGYAKHCVVAEIFAVSLGRIQVQLRQPNCRFNQQATPPRTFDQATNKNRVL